MNRVATLAAVAAIAATALTAPPAYAADATCVTRAEADGTFVGESRPHAEKRYGNGTIRYEGRFEGWIEAGHFNFWQSYGWCQDSGRFWVAYKDDPGADEVHWWNANL